MTKNDNNDQVENTPVTSHRNTRLVQGITFDEFVKLTTIYSDPTRRYHGLNHINNLQGHLQQYVKHLEKENPEFLNNFSVVDVMRAIWFHDSVYNVYLTDAESERCSAVFSFVENDPFIDSQVEQNLVYRMICATAKHTEDQTFEGLDDFEVNTTQVMLDLDMAELGADWETFERNTQNIRKEYFFVSDEAFAKGRSAFFKKLLTRKSIYYSDYFKERFEAKARENIRISMAKLDASY